MIHAPGLFADPCRGAPDSAEREQIFLAATARAFPNIAVGRLAPGFRGSVRGRTVAGHPIARVRTSGCVVDASAARGKAAGLEGWFKLVWQISSGSRVEDADGAFRLEAGELAILPMSADYQFQMDRDFDGLMIVFNPAPRTEWIQIVHDHMRRPFKPRGAIAAAGAGVASLVRHANGEPTDILAIDAALDLVFRTITQDQTPSTARLRRAAALVEQRLDDRGYGPGELARDLGVSRRSLYEVFARAGLTPAGYIRQIRLGHAQRDILRARERPVSLTRIAMDNGFADSSSFSRAFKDAFGLSPRAWRDNIGSRKVQD